VFFGDNSQMKSKFTSTFLVLSLLLGQMILPIQPMASETKVHSSSTKLVFSERSKDRYIGNITLIAASLVSMYQLKRCLNPAISCGFSTITSALAGVALLAGEIVNIATHEHVLKNLKYNQAKLDETKDECLSGDAGNEKINSSKSNEVCSQLGAIISQRDAYQSLRRGLMVQASLRAAAGVAYLVAMGIEIFAAIKKAASDSAVITAAAGAQASCTAFAAGPQAAVCGESVARCEVALAGFQTYMAGKFVELNNPVPIPSMMSCTSIRSKHQSALRAVQMACSTGCCAGNVGPLLVKLGVETTTLNCMANFKSCDLGCQPAGVALVQNQNETLMEMPSKKWISSMMNLISSPVYAKSETSVNSILQQLSSGLSLGVFGGAIIGGIMTSEKYIGDTLFSTPVKRSVWYGAVGAIVATSSFHTQTALDEVDGHIRSLNKIIRVGGTELAAQTNINSVNSVMSSSVVGANFEENADVSSSVFDSLRNLNCPNGGDGKSGCLNTPESLFTALKEVKLNGIAGVVSNIESLGDEILGPEGKMENAQKLANDISSNKALVKNFVDESKKKLLTLQKKNNVSPINFDQEISKVVDQLKKQTSESIKKNNPSFALNSQLASTSDFSKVETEDEKKINAAAINSNSNFEESDEITEPQISFNLNSPAEINPEVDHQTELRREKILTANALVDREKSIWQAITLRYQKTGYSALLEEY